LVAGGALAAVGLSRRSKAGLALAAAGGAIAYSGIKSNQLPHEPIVGTSLLVNCTPQEAYRMWRDFENMPLFMNHIESVTAIDDRRYKWTAVTPVGVKLQWNVEIDTERPGELISWHSLPGSDVNVTGNIVFRTAPANRGTLLVVVLEYRPAARSAARALVNLVGKTPSRLLRQDLRRFKALVETGEIPTIEGQSHGPRSRVTGVMRAMDPTEPIRGEARFSEVVEARRRVS
jgi:uncharacterized membrane protein